MNPSDLADKYDVQEWQRSFLAKTTEFVQQSVDFLGLSKSSDSEGPSSANGSSDVSLLDYACGTGALSRALGPFVSHIQGVDLSTKMVERYNQLAATSIIPSVQKATARVGDLLSEAEPAGELSGPELHGFSFAGVSAGFHHFERLQLAIDRLAGRLRPGGVLFILDFVEEEGVSLVTSTLCHKTCTCSLMRCTASLTHRFAEDVSFLCSRRYHT